MARKQLIIEDNYIPRPWQRGAHFNVKRHNIFVFHRRGGKSVFSVSEIKDKSIRFEKNDPKTGLPFRNPQFAYVATTVGQVEKIAWAYFKEYMKDIPGVKFNETKLRITFPHRFGTCTIFLFGAENFDNMRGIYLDGYVLDEYGDMHPDVRDKVLLPTLSDREGWEIIIGTPKGDNAFKQLYYAAIDDPDWHTMLVKASESGILPESELKMLRKTMSEEAFLQEYECDFNATPQGFYYDRLVQEAVESGRVTCCPYDPQYGVGTFWDLGVTDSCTIWYVQEIGMRPVIIDYDEDHSKGLPHYLELLESKPYQYVGHFLPHDGGHKDKILAQTPAQYLESHGLQNVRIVPKSKNVNEDIHTVRMFLMKAWFDREKTALGLKALRNYQRKYDSKERVYSKNPVHNWASHGADGFRQLAVSYEVGILSGVDPQDNLPEEADGDYDYFEI